MTASRRAPLLEVSDLQVEFPTEDGVVHAVRGVSYSLEAGEVLGIVGESGSGKSVSSLALMGLLPRGARISGSAKYRGDELLGLEARDLNVIRGKKVAMIFQDPMTSLNPVHRVGAQIGEAIWAAGVLSKGDANKRAVELLDLVGIPQAGSRARSYPHEFSGGMRQRAMIAMAMANDPDVLIADEPTTALDVTVQAQILETLRKVQGETGAAMILITHDLGVVANMSDRVMVMYAGRPVEYGTVDDLYERPRMPYTVGLLGSLPRLDAEGERLTPITGSPPSLLNLPAGCPFAPRCPMVRDRCLSEEPPLYLTDEVEHVAACHFWMELGGEVIATEVFEVTTVDDAEPLS
ncbi:MAG: glutathione transport system ATP-binding protein [Actinomycetota bacterium]|jgi:oligopeptide/dipeptide ABC transporter ATP-binding protein|nr:glutathione transport system ATP-binding protein [Actinomycetota bacterium]